MGEVEARVSSSQRMPKNSLSGATIIELRNRILLNQLEAEIREDEALNNWKHEVQLRKENSEATAPEDTSFYDLNTDINTSIKEIEQKYGWEYCPEKNGGASFMLLSNFQIDKDNTDILFRINRVRFNGFSFEHISESSKERDFLEDASTDLAKLGQLMIKKKELYIKEEFPRQWHELKSGVATNSISRFIERAADTKNIADQLHDLSYYGTNEIYMLLAIINRLAEESWDGAALLDIESTESQKKSMVFEVLSEFNNRNVENDDLETELHKLQLASIYSYRAKLLYDKARELLEKRKSQYAGK